MSKVFCTIVDEAYVPRALVLGESIARHGPSARFAYYCMDDAAADLLEMYCSARDIVVRPAVYETDELKSLKGVRKINEYSWTCKPAILIHAAQSDLNPQWVVWLDADMMAFGDMARVLTRFSGASAVLTPHRFTLPKFAAFEPSVGRFNAGFVAFHMNGEGRAALDWWMAKCLQGCPAVPEADRYADQKYLNEMPKLFPNTAVDAPLGLNAALWNIFGRNIAVENGEVAIDGEPLFLYHFQGLKIIRSWLYDLYGSTPSVPKIVRRAVYEPYVLALTAKIRDCAARLDRPLFGVDQGFFGLVGFAAAIKRLRWSPNMIVRL